jgi:general stress protein YciG
MVEKNDKVKSKRGFAAMSAERKKQIASLGGKTAHEKGVAHKWNKKEAVEAGRKGGQISGFKRKRRNEGSEELL